MASYTQAADDLLALIADGIIDIDAPDLVVEIQPVGQAPATDTVIDWDAIRAEEDAKRLKWEAETVVGNWTIAEMRVAFDAVQDRTNWKLPIAAAIEASDVALVSDAVIHFTGSVASLEVLPNGKVLVTAAGYYEAVGA